MAKKRKLTLEEAPQVPITLNAVQQATEDWIDCFGLRGTVLEEKARKKFLNLNFTAAEITADKERNMTSHHPIVNIRNGK